MQTSLCPTRPVGFHRHNTQLLQGGRGSVRVVAAHARTAGRTKLQGSHDWTDLIHHDGITAPREIPEDLRRVLIKYGELTQITYDSFYGDAKDTSTFGKPANEFMRVCVDGVPVSS